MKYTEKQNRTERQSDVRCLERQRKKLNMKTQIETGKGKRKRCIC